MTRSQEHSYYEIALTGTQMIVGFVVVLAALLLAFFSGIWVGRDADAAAAPESAATAPPPEQEAATDLEQFDFFSQEPAEPSREPVEATPPSPARVAERADPETTLLEDVEGEESTRRGPAEQTESAATPAAGELVIQVFSSDDETQATEVVNRLQSAGLPAYLVSGEVEGRQMHRVRVGPYADRAEAERIAGRVRRDFRLDTWITTGG